MGRFIDSDSDFVARMPPGDASGQRPAVRCGRFALPVGGVRTGIDGLPRRHPDDGQIEVEGGAVRLGRESGRQVCVEPVLRIDA